MSFTFKLSFRSVLYRFRQYLALFLICCFGTAVSLSMLFLSRGMLKSLSGKAEIYYGGDLVLMRFGAGEREQSIPSVTQYEKILASVLPEGSVISSRFDFNGKNNGSLYFEGNETKVNVIKGVDFEKEKDLISRFNFISGDFDIKKGEPGVLVSSQIAKILGLSLEDSFTFLLRTKTGQINTVQLEVRGIFCDSSVFGMYTLYVDKDFLLDSFMAEPDWANRICVQLPQDFKVTRSQLEKWNKSLSTRVNVFPVYDNKQDFYEKMPFAAETFALVPLKANLSDLSVLERAMKLIISSIVFVMVLIIVAGIGSTFKVLVMKRINEIGIYMALGMKKFHIIFMLVAESFILLFAGFVAGLVLSAFLCGAASLPNLSFIPSMDIFLEGGSLSPVFSLKMTLILLLTIIITTLLVVFRAVKQSVSILPANALNATR